MSPRGLTITVLLILLAWFGWTMATQYTTVGSEWVPNTPSPSATSQIFEVIGTVADKSQVLDLMAGGYMTKISVNIISSEGKFEKGRVLNINLPADTKQVNKDDKIEIECYGHYGSVLECDSDSLKKVR